MFPQHLPTRDNTMAQQQQQQGQDITINMIAGQGIKLIRQLRQNLTKTFQFMGDGVQNRTSAETSQQQTNDVSNEQMFSKELKQNLNSLMESFE